MNWKRKWSKPHGLRSRLVFSLITAVILWGVVFSGLYLLIENVLTDYFANSDFEEIHTQMQGESLQNFIDRNEISSKDLSKLEEWENRQPVILLELYSGPECIYSSVYEYPIIPERILQRSKGYTYGKEENTVSVQLTDREVIAILYSDYTYRYYMGGITIAFLISMIAAVAFYLAGIRKLIWYICRLNDEVQILEGGNLGYPVTEQGNDELTDLAKSMNHMRQSFQEQLETEQQLYQASRQLVTEMSHDLRTPLTGIMLYLEILKTHRYENDEQLMDYLNKIDAKAHHMKVLSDHLFEYTLDGTPQKQNEPLPMEAAFKDALSDFRDDLDAHGFSCICEPEWDPCFVQVRPEYVHRIFENIVSNISKYAIPKEKVWIDTISSKAYCGFTIMNPCSSENADVESNGIGIESVRTMMQQMKGSCTVEQTESVYEITLLFPKQ